ncbi:SinI family autotransporter-associated protein [Yersinia similis]|uniref:SinI family autotransporter-associated protein n=1 Tax=Yersinia similis TaxID=367190 RepID=UPI0011A2AF04|nr:SinI family autotransporter-associated protein [Yersinia similis]
MHSNSIYTLKKLALALMLASCTISNAYAVLIPVAGAIQGSAPTLSAPSNSALHAVDLSSNAAGATLASGDTIILTYTYNDADEDLDNSTDYVNWYYTKGDVDTQIATTSITNRVAKTNGGEGRSVLIIPATAIGADAIKVVIQEFSASGDPISGQTISVAETSIGGGGTTTRPGPIAPGSNVTPGIYLDTDTLFTNNLLGAETSLSASNVYVFKLWDNEAVGVIDLTNTVHYNWRLLGVSATDSVAAPTTGFVTSVANADFSVPMNTAADGTQLTGSADGMQGFQLTVDYN